MALNGGDTREKDRDTAVEIDHQKPANQCREATSPLNTAVRRCDGYRSTTEQDHDSG